MHEVSLMENTLNIALAQAKQANAAKIDFLTMEIGDLSGVIPEALEFAFEVLRPGTIAENAQLEINSVAVVCHCQLCNCNFQPEAYIYTCPRCQQVSNKIIAGKELELVSIVVS